jgi:hypothetical protein
VLLLEAGGLCELLPGLEAGAVPLPWPLQGGKPVSCR